MTSPAAELDQFREQVSEHLSRVTAQLGDELRPVVRELVHAPGKRLRSSLLLGCALMGRPHQDRIVKLGACIELLHHASLLHDDVVDRSPLRRGRASGRAVLGDERALLAGLAAFALAGTEVAELGAGASAAFARASGQLANGQLLDVERAFDTTLSVQDYEHMVAEKTGALFVLAAHVGGTEARLSTLDRARLVRFATDLGVAFQILDDCLDLDGNQIDKPFGLDHLRGMFGAPTLLALLRDDGELRSLLLSVDTGRDQLAAVRDLVLERGGLAAARQLAGERIRRARSALTELEDAKDRGREIVQVVCAGLWDAVA